MVDFLKKRLQIFVSSTYTDLKDERQAAVEAVLIAGHIPAGMELFTAGDETQMEVIRQWIDESDIYLLLLGGRYGSIDTKSNKSYTHLEYEYATSRGKPTFALVITEHGLDRLVQERGRGVIESQNPQGLNALRSEVLGKLVRFWTDSKDIRIAVGETLSQFARRDDLKGWVRPQDQSNVPEITSELVRLSKENAALREQLSSAANSSAPLGIGYPSILRMLESKSLLNILRSNATTFNSIHGISERDEFLELLELGLLTRLEDRRHLLVLSEHGKSFLNWLKLQELESSGFTSGLHDE